MKALHIITDLDCGGAETMLVRLCSCAEEGQLAVLSLKTPGVLAGRLQQIGVPVFSLEMKGPLLLPVHLKRLRSILREVDAKLYWGWMYHGALIAAFAGMVQKIPVVWNFRQTLDRISRERLSTQGVLLMLRFLQSIPFLTVYNAEQSYQQHREFGFRGRSTVIPNGFADSDFYFSADLRREAREYYGLSSSSTVVGHAARFHPMKGHHEFFEAVLPLILERDDLFVLCCGKDVDDELLPERFPKERVRFVGIEENMNRFYNALDVFCSSSTWGEGFSNVVGEAMLVGIPCVVTDIGYSRELVGSQGSVVPAGDVPELKKSLLQQISTIQSIQLEFRERSRALMQQKFSLCAIAKEYWRVEDLVNE